MFAALSGIRSNTAEILRLVQGLSRPEGLSQDALLILARRINAAVDDPATARRELERAVDIAANVLREGLRGSSLDAIVNEVLKRLAALTGAGRFAEAQAEAERALAEAEDGEERAKARRDRLLASALETAILNRDPEATARHLLRRLDLDVTAPQDGFDALRALQDEWYVRGRDKGLAFDLEASIALARVSRNRAHNADQRGAALNDLGNALETLGTRESGTARLKEAVAAYRAALTEFTRDRVPLDWAMTQMNLGNALRALGTRESGTARLEEAVAAYHAALTEWKRDRVPLNWATAQMNLGAALADLGARESGTARLGEAAAAFHAALTEFNCDRVPLDWATAQMNLGNALATLGARESGPTRLEEAVAAYRAALTELTRDRVPLDWANTTGNLGSAQRVLADRTSDLGLARDALANLRRGERELREGGHVVWAATFERQIPDAEALIARLS
jgi:tetratricopeptide (TPR) repeat protein